MVNLARNGVGPLVSVLIPVYNPGIYLNAALDSILGQTYQNIEVIAVNDGSTDDSVAVLERYQRQDRRFRYINQQNQGLSTAINRAMGLASGEFIARMDADDTCAKTRLESQIDYLIKHPEIGIVGAQHQVVRPSGEVISVSNYPTEPAALEWIFFFLNAMSHPTVLMRREAVSIVGEYSLKYRVAQDYEYWTRAVINGIRIANLPDILYRYRTWQKNTSTVYPAQQVQAMKLITSAYASVQLKHEVSSELIALLHKLNQGSPTAQFTEIETDSILTYITDVLEFFALRDGLNPSERRFIRRDAATRLLTLAYMNRKSAPKTALLTLIRALKIDPASANVLLDRAIAKLRPSGSLA